MVFTAASSLLLTSLSTTERDRLTPYLETVRLNRGDVLTEVGSNIDYVWFPHDCVTSTVVDTPEGRTIEVGLAGLEGLVGLSLVLGTEISNTTVIVQVQGRASRMRAADFRAQVVEPRGETYRALLRYTDAFIAMIAQTAACNSLHALHERLARWILMAQDRVGRDSLPLTQEFIAYMLGVRRATVSIAASELQNRALIHYSRGEIFITNRPGLEEASCACYGIVRNLTRRIYGGQPNGRYS